MLTGLCVRGIVGRGGGGSKLEAAAVAGSVLVSFTLLVFDAVPPSSARDSEDDSPRLLSTVGCQSIGPVLGFAGAGGELGGMGDAADVVG